MSVIYTVSFKRIKSKSKHLVFPFLQMMWACIIDWKIMLHAEYIYHIKIGMNFPVALQPHNTIRCGQ